MILQFRSKSNTLSLLLFLSVLNGFSQRIETDFNPGWRFILEDNPEFSIEEFNDNSWKELSVHHDWSFEKGVRLGGDKGQGGGYHDAKTGANSIKLETTGESAPYLDELFID